MKVIKRSRENFFELGLPMLNKDFAELVPRIAAGLSGHGSECYGYDDDVSLDHDVDYGFCLWLTRADCTAYGKELQEAYSALPLPFPKEKSLYNGPRNGVICIDDFLSSYLGSPELPTSWRQWLYTPSYALAEVTNGEVWHDPSGLFTEIRKKLSTGMPLDVKFKKISSRLISMAQSGQYNYKRCIAHGEEGAAMLAMDEFVRSCCDLVFLLNDSYCPYFKWMFKAMEPLPLLGDLKYSLEYLLTGPNDEAGRESKSLMVEDICSQVITVLKERKLTDGNWDYLEPHAYEVMERISDPEIRALHIMEG